ncbi:MAG: hypothetical protein RL068_531 [Actinomycetota bacterium]
MLALYLASGFALARLLGARHLLHSLALGLGLAVIWRTISFSALYLIGLAEHSQMAWLLGAIAAILATVALQLRDRSLWLGLATSSLLAIVAATLTRGLGLRGIPHSDSLWILTLSDLFQRAGDLEIVGGRTAIKRGFAYPLSLALGPEGSGLTGLTPLIFIALVAAVIWAVIELSPQLSKAQWAWILIPLAVVLATAPIVLRAIWYVNGHTLTALGMTLAIAAVVMAVRDQVLTRTGLATIMVGLALISLTRPEGVAFAAVIAAPLISRRWVSRWDVRLIAFSAFGSFGLWMYLYDGYIPDLIRMYDERFPVLMLIASYLAGLKMFDWLRFRLLPLALIGMIGLLAFVLVRNFSSLTDDLWAQFQNMFLGAGFWGGLFIAIVLAFVLSGWKERTPSYKLLATISLMLVLGSLAAKLMDGGLFGDPTIGRLGWTDSLNRMWLHSFGIFIITAIVGYAESLTKTKKVAK